MYNDDGSLKKGINGDYYFSISEVLTEAWQHVNGSKLIFLATLFIYIVITGALTTAISFIFDSQSYYNAGMMFKGFLSDQAISWLTMPATVPVLTGIVMLGIKRAGNKEMEIPSIFNYYVLVWPLVFASILMNIFILAGFMLFVLPGIYLATAYMFTLPLIVDKNLQFFEAMETSRKAVTKHWFKLFGLNLAVVFIIGISAIPAGIGLFWTIPLAFIANGILYRKIFGYETGSDNISENPQG